MNIMTSPITDNCHRHLSDDHPTMGEICVDVIFKW